MKQKLKYLSVSALDLLRSNVADNLDRYSNGEFNDLIEESGSSIALNSVEYDPDLLSGLSGESTSDASNAMIVWNALPDLTPSLATEDRIWTRLSHLDCLDYARSRWLKTHSGSDLEKAVNDHMFAGTLTRYRDDNAVSRLWWAAYIAGQIWPDDRKGAVELILSKTDIRSNFIERSAFSSRPQLAAGILREMKNQEWVTEKESNFRSFMMTVNKYGGGKLFEMMNDGEVDKFMETCSTKAMAA